jgi:HAD superfamily phosphoserine phosphatase-like hydrolase
MNGPTSIAAFFDLDGTLLPPPSLEWRFISYLLWHDRLGTSNILRWLARVGFSLHQGPRQAFEANKQYVARLPESLVEDWMKSCGASESNPNTLNFFHEGLNRIEWHQSQNHRVFLVSGTLAPLARCVANRLPGNVQVIATELTFCVTAAKFGGESALKENLHPPIWTGEIRGEHMVGLAKSRAVRSMAAEHELDLAKCFAYGDSWADRAMLESVGFPVAVNPSSALARLAKKRGWPVSHWGSIRPAHGRMPVRFDSAGLLRKTNATENSQS